MKRKAPYQNRRDNPRKERTTPAVVIALIGAAATIVAAFIALFGNVFSTTAPINSTKTAEALLTSAAKTSQADFSTSTDVLTPPVTPSATSIATVDTPSSTPTSTEEANNMVFIPAGEFLRGSSETEDADGDERPQRSTYLDDFWIDRTEVTNAMFAQFVSETGYQTGAESTGRSYVLILTSDVAETVDGANWQHPRGPASNIEGLEGHPVVQVNWEDARAYCTWAGKRLPTEAEWEKVARGTDGQKYPWGNHSVAGNYLNFADKILGAPWSDSNFDDGYKYTAPVGSYPDGMSPYGVLDMAGNVWEWVIDFYDSGYYADSPDENPQGPSTGQDRVLRGGSWAEGDYIVRTALRASPGGSYVPAAPIDDVGFRCARSQ